MLANGTNNPQSDRDAPEADDLWASSEDPEASATSEIHWTTSRVGLRSGPTGPEILWVDGDGFVESPPVCAAVVSVADDSDDDADDDGFFSAPSRSDPCA
jgi:hypothetical protein